MGRGSGIFTGSGEGLALCCGSRGALIPAEGRLQAGEKRAKVLLHIPFIAVIGGTIHVDCYAGNDHEIAVNVNKARGDAVFGADENAPGGGQRTVQPGGENHAAVFFNIKRDVLVFHCDLGIALNAEGGRIQVAGHDVEGGWDRDAGGFRATIFRFGD